LQRFLLLTPHLAGTGTCTANSSLAGTHLLEGRRLACLSDNRSGRLATKRSALDTSAATTCGVLNMSRIIVVGAGINGVTAAIELKKRGHEVMVVDPGPLPHALAASTDISKAVRAAYGADEDYTALAERSIKLWRQWNEEFGTKLYHEIGVMFVRRQKMDPGDFEYESLKLLENRGLNVARMNTPELWKRCPAWNTELYR